jgi:NitT/TauT family transport system permease protein
MTARQHMSVRILWIKIITILVIVTVWELTARSGLFFEGVVPSTVSVLGALARELSDQRFYRDLGVTMLESSVGFLFGSIIAIIVGIALGLNSYLRRMIEPFILAIGGTPKIVFLPILFLVFGLGIESKMAKAALSAFFPVAVSATSGFIQIPDVLIRVGQSFHLDHWQMVTKIYIPAMLKPLLTGLRLGMAVAIIGVLSAEITYSDRGLGFRLIRNADQFQISAVYAIAILIFATAASINFALSKVEQHYARHERGRRNDEALTVGLSPS